MARSRNTDVLHRGEGAPDGATPLGRPIYTSSTFVFANAAAVEAYQRAGVGPEDRRLAADRGSRRAFC